MKRIVVIHFVLLFILITGLSGIAGAKDVYELKVTYHHSPNHLIARSIVAAYTPLEAMSGGRLKIKFYGAGALAKGLEAYDAIQSGAADLGHITPSYWPGRFPLTTLGDLPGMIPNALAGTFAFNELTNTTPYIKKEYDEVVVLGWFAATPYRLIMKNKISNIDQLKGLRLRSAGGYQTKTIEKLGAVPVMMGSGEIYTSLSRGLLDGIPYPYASMPPHRFYESCKYVVDNLLFGSLVMGQIMNKASWDKLPPDLQAMVKEAGETVGRLCGMNYANDSIMAVPYLKSKGVEIFDVPASEEAKFNEILSPLHKEWIAEMESKGLPGKEVYDAFTKILSKYTKRWK